MAVVVTAAVPSLFTPDIHTVLEQVRNVKVLARSGALLIGAMQTVPTRWTASSIDRSVRKDYAHQCKTRPQCAAEPIPVAENLRVIDVVVY
jgi:hypothetical protein